MGAENLYKLYVASNCNVVPYFSNLNQIDQDIWERFAGKVQDWIEAHYPNCEACDLICEPDEA